MKIAISVAAMQAMEIAIISEGLSAWTLNTRTNMA